MNVDNQLRGRLKDLAHKAYQKNIYTFTNFLSPADLEVFFQMKGELDFVDYRLFGGREYCDRVIIGFGSEKSTGYIQDFPISVIKLAPLMDKFSEPISHRDVLGALMNLGIEREMIGDIIVKQSEKSGMANIAFVYCVSSIAEYIVENLSRIKHTTIRADVCTDVPELSVSFEEFSLIAASPRMDAVVAGITRLSRSRALELFREKKIFLNNRVCENNSYMLKEKDVISIRGYGKFSLKSIGGETRKGRCFMTLLRYV